VNSKEIHFFSEDIKFVLPNKIKVRKWISEVLRQEKKELISLNYVFCSDAFLLDLNIKYLHHNSYTDIITFNNAENSSHIISDVFISVERVRDNSKNFNTPFLEEIHRVMIHGLLHLFGYNDKKRSEIETMRKKEDYYLSLLPNFIHN
jgi:rRNA maturation RNase YbeY